MNPGQQRAAVRAAERAHARVVEDIERARADAGISARALARASGVDAGYLCRILAGEAHPSLATYARLSGVLGLDLALRAYPNTGPLIRDRHQARILEVLLATLHARWKPYTEVAVRHPGRGWIDAVLHDAAAALLVATEIQSELRRLDQIIRWSAEKAASLPSWDGWTPLGEPRTSQLLIVRRTRATRQTASEFERQLRLAFPAHPDDALAALAGTSPWPGPALLWASIDARGTRFVHGR